MDDAVQLAQRFEAQRGHLRAVAYRMLGSLTEADDAVQECWLRISRADTSGVENLGAWLTTVVARVCLDALRSRRSRNEELLDTQMPERIPGTHGHPDPEDEALLADSVGLAMLVVLGTLSPAERVAFVLHDMFAVPFDEIAPVLGRSSAAARQLASRARRRVQNGAAPPAADRNRQWEAVEAFLAAARDGDFDALLALLDPEIELRVDLGPAGTHRFRGARTVAEQAMAYSSRAPYARLAMVGGMAGIVVVAHGRVLETISFTVAKGKIAGMYILGDPARLQGFAGRQA